MADPENTHLGGGRYATGSFDTDEPVSANPSALRSYANDAPEPTDSVRTLAGTTGVALAGFRQNAALAEAQFQHREGIEWHDGWTDANGTAKRATEAVADLCDDFDHLDAFVGSVADAFFAAEGLNGDDSGADQVFTLTAGDIEAHGIGFASRSESIAHGEALAETFEGFDETTTVEELDAWADAVAVIQNDTAGSVALVEGMGADGLEQLPTIELADGDIPDVVVGVVGSSLETALDTLPRDEPWEHTDPANADLPLDQRLDPGVHVDLLDNPDALVPYTTPETPNINHTLGRADARHIDNLINDLDDGDLYNQNLTNTELIEAYHGLQPVMERPEHLRDDDSYTASMLNELGAENTDHMIELGNSFGLVHPAMEESAVEVYDGYVAPFASIVSTAEQSGMLDQSVHDAIFHPEHLGRHPDRVNGTESGNRRARTLLLHEGDFSPEATAALADIAITGGGIRAGRHREGFTTTEFLTSRPDLAPLADNAWTAYNALDANPEASFIHFSNTGNISDVTRGWPVDTHLTGSVEMAADRLDRDEDQVLEEMQWAAADALYSGLHDYPILADAHGDPEVIDTITTAIQYTGRDGGNGYLADPTRIRMAEISTPYSADLAVAGTAGEQVEYEQYDRLNDLAEDDVDRFFEAVTANEDAMVIMSANGAALTEGLAAWGLETGNESSAMWIAGGYQREIGQALNANHYSDVAAAEAAYAGQRVYTDLTANLAINAVASLPHARVAAATPPGQDVVGHFRNEARDALADVILGEPTIPDREGVEDWYHETAGELLPDSLRRALFNHEESREEIIAHARENDPSNPLLDDAHDDYEAFSRLTETGTAIRDLEGPLLDQFRSQADPDMH